MIKIYHNNRCSKSRCGLDILKKSGKPFEIIKYLENTPSTKEITQIIKLLKIKPIELVRKNEAIWKEKFKDQELSDKNLIEIMVQHQKLIERPIVINGNKATIGRPPNKILDII
jgi:arsenate reductase